MGMGLEELVMSCLCKRSTHEPCNLYGPYTFWCAPHMQVRCMLNIWGVMLFIRMTWIVGQAGIGRCDAQSTMYVSSGTLVEVS